MKKSNTEALKTISAELSIIRESEQGEDEKSDLSDAICAIEELLSRERQEDHTESDEGDEISKLKKENEQLRFYLAEARFSACLSRIKYKDIRCTIDSQETRAITETELRFMLSRSDWDDDSEVVVETAKRSGWLKD
jgi:hypothetical protein